MERDEQGRVRIIDLKTGSSKPSAAEIERHRQLGSYQLAVQAMQRMCDGGSLTDPLRICSAFDAFGLALLVEGELRKLGQPIPAYPIQGDLFDEGEGGGMPRFTAEQFRQLIAGEVCVEARQW